MDLLKMLVHPLASRKNRVALVTIIAAYAANAGLDLGTEMLMTIVGIGVALILGIAHEDNGAKRNTK